MLGRIDESGPRRPDENSETRVMEHSNRRLQELVPSETPMQARFNLDPKFRAGVLASVSSTFIFLRHPGKEAARIGGMFEVHTAAEIGDCMEGCIEAI